MVSTLGDFHAGGIAGETHEYFQMQEVGRDAQKAKRSGYGIELWINGVHIVWEGGGRSGVGSGTI